MTISDAAEFIKSNQMLVAGVGTVLLGSLMYVVKGVPRWLFYTIKRISTLEMSLNSDSHSYHELLRTLNRYRVPFLSRTFSTDVGGTLGAGYGLSVAWYQGRLVLFERHLIESNMRLDERLDMTVFGRDSNILRSLMQESQEPQDADYIKIYVSESGGWWSSSIRKRKRSLDTIFANADVKTTIVDRISWFLANRDWYLQRGIPYKLVFLLHGEPGTGKTSLVYGTASHFNRSLAALGSINSVGEHLRNVPPHSFVVIEDIDMLSVSREDDAGDKEPPKDKKQSAPPLSALHALINTVDGLGTPDGLILFATTNYKDRLDPALVRPGRVDCDLEIARLDRDETEAMFVAFFGEEHRADIRRYTQSTEFHPRTGADLQTLFACNYAESALRSMRGVHLVAV